MYVAASHATVLRATVISMITESFRGSPAGNQRPGIVTKHTPEITSDAIIAVISDHALIRHQYHRRISTRPVPAPSASRKRQAPSTDDSCHVTSVDARKSPTVARRDTPT